MITQSIREQSVPSFFSSLKLSIKTFRIGVNSSPDFGQSYFDPLCALESYELNLVWTFLQRIFKSIPNRYVNKVQIQNKNKTKLMFKTMKSLLLSKPLTLSPFLI